MRLKTIALGAALIGLPSLALAQHSGTLEEQMACTQDVYSYCASQIPDESSIVTCLERNRSRLSPACRAVFSKPHAVKQRKGQGQQDDDQEEDGFDF